MEIISRFTNWIEKNQVSYVMFSRCCTIRFWYVSGTKILPLNLVRRANSSSILSSLYITSVNKGVNLNLAKLEIKLHYPALILRHRERSLRTFHVTSRFSVDLRSSYSYKFCSYSADRTAVLVSILFVVSKNFTLIGSWSSINYAAYTRTVDSMNYKPNLNSVAF